MGFPHGGSYEGLSSDGPSFIISWKAYKHWSFERRRDLEILSFNYLLSSITKSLVISTLMFSITQLTPSDVTNFTTS